MEVKAADSYHVEVVLVRQELVVSVPNARHPTLSARVSVAAMVVQHGD